MFGTSVAGSCAAQLSSCVARGPNIASGSGLLSSPVVVTCTIGVISARASSSLEVSIAPEYEPAPRNMSGWRAAIENEQKPPCDSPKIWRPARVASVRRLRSIHGMTWPTSKVSHSGLPPAPRLYQSVQ